MQDSQSVSDSIQVVLRGADGAQRTQTTLSEYVKVTGRIDIFLRDFEGKVIDERHIENLVVTIGKTHISKVLQNAVSTGSNLSVSGTANSSGLIKVTTSTNHNLQTGQDVFIYNVGGTTEANGAWVVTKVDATNFTLNGSVFSNAWTSGGTVIPGQAEMQWMAIGIGTTAPAITDTDMQTEISTGLTTRAVNTRTNPTTAQVQYSATWSPGQATNTALTEIGIFNDSAFGPTSGTMLAHATFSAVAKGASDTLTVNWQITFS